MRGRIGYRSTATAFSVSVMIFLSGCVTGPTYVERNAGSEHDESAPADGGAAFPLTSTEVSYYLNDQAWIVAERGCVFIANVPADIHPRLASETVEDHLASYLARYFDRVIVPVDAEALEREYGVSARNGARSDDFASLTGCRMEATVETSGSGSVYAGFWAQERIGLELSLRETFPPFRTIWSAHHIAVRQDGGIPISPIGAVSGFVRAGYVVNDAEIPESLLSVAIQRMFATLPRLRG